MEIREKGDNGDVRRWTPEDRKRKDMQDSEGDERIA